MSEQSPAAPLCTPDSMQWYLIPIYAQLRALWLAANPGVPMGKLSEVLDAPKQKVSQWATGSGDTRPPWHVIMKLCQILDVVVVLSPAGLVIFKAPPMDEAAQQQLEEQALAVAAAKVKAEEAKAARNQAGGSP